MARRQQEDQHPDLGGHPPVPREVVPAAEHDDAQRDPEIEQEVDDADQQSRMTMRLGSVGGWSGTAEATSREGTRTCGLGKRTGRPCRIGQAVRPAGLTVPLPPGVRLILAVALILPIWPIAAAPRLPSQPAAPVA